MGGKSGVLVVMVVIWLWIGCSEGAVSPTNLSDVRGGMRGGEVNKCLREDAWKNKVVKDASPL